MNAMRGIEEESGEFLGPSRGELRREALAVLELAERLVKLPHARLLQLPLSEDLVGHVMDAQRITAQIAHKRQVGFLAKKLRREDDELLTSLRTALDHDKSESRRENAALHRIEALRDRLIEEGDSALSEIVAEHPHADRQHLRQLARNAKEEKLRNKPPHAYRELFRELRELMNADAEDPSDP
nr:ribosome biogenesis factor YjgA [Arenimonas oryziterrae]